jgi:ferrous iron transport protein B
MERNIRNIFLIGNPNSGKSSLFNQLTGLNQKIANYPGVTTERKIGSFYLEKQQYELVDLPGCYSLYPNSIDEKVVINELLQNKPDLILFVADASNLYRSLLLYTQVADFNFPIAMVLNMVDELESKGEVVNASFLESELGCPVFLCNSKKRKGIDSLQKYIIGSDFHASIKIFGNKQLFSNYLSSSNLNYASWHEYVQSTPSNAIVENIKRIEVIERYNKIESIIALTVSKTEKAFNRQRFTEKLDKYLMHKYYGFIFLLLILYLVFQTLFTLAQFPMTWLDSGFGYMAHLINNLDSKSSWLTFISEAVIPGISGVLIFIPQIALLFLMNTFLEESGYMARIVFLLDNWMRKFGMSGKSVLPLLSGNACAIPAIASTKAIPTHKERLITILCIPFMTCSARLPVYTLLISIVIPLEFQGLSLLSLYALGVIFAMLFGWILNKNISSSEKSFLIMELPPYRLPSFKNIYINIKNAVVAFVKVAGKFIVTISIVLWFLASFGWQNQAIQKTNIETSFAASIGKTIEPAIKPLGYDWKIGVALVTSFAAREVFVSTLGMLYNIGEEATERTMIEKMKSQVYPQTQLPVFNLASGVSLLLFYAFALQCMSTLAAIKKETDTFKWAIISFLLMASLAYTSAFIAFQFLKKC